MSEILNFLITSFGLLIIFPLIALRLMNAQKKSIIEFFVGQGYEEVKRSGAFFTYTKFKDPNSDLTIESESNLLKIKTSNDHNFQFTIESRLKKFPTSYFDYLEDLKHSEKFIITTTSAIKINFLFSSSFKAKLDEIFSYIWQVDVKSKDGSMEIKIGLKNTDAHHLKKTMPFVDYILPELKSPDLQIIRDYEEYICFNCDENLPYIGDVCINCGVIAPKCVVCLIDPEPNESIVLFSCCRSYSHESHARMWIAKKDICPSCRTEHPEIIPIKEPM